MMTFSNMWWLLAGLAVVAELLTGTVYLLLIAAGFAAAALASYWNLHPSLQVVVAAVIGAGLVLVWWRIRAPARRAALSPQADRDLNLDIGQTVLVGEWQAGGTASVMHRGARWTAVSPDGGAPAPGLHRIVALSGSSLVVVPV